MIDAARHVQGDWPKVQALAADERVPSPCNDVCRIDLASGFCEGCLRTIDEVVGWGASSDEQKREVWEQLKLRADAIAGGRPHPSPLPEGEGGQP